MSGLVAFKAPSFFTKPGILSLLLGVSSLDLGRVNLHGYYIIIPFAMSRFGWDVRAPLGLFSAEIIVSFWF
jgi:hypothetical protein